MKQILLPFILAFTLLISPSDGWARTCCKICATGKACGNSCISRKKTCHKRRGCACNARVGYKMLGLNSPSLSCP